MTLLDRYVLGLVGRRTAVLAGVFYAILVGGQGILFAGRGVPLESLPALLVPLVLFATPLVLPLALGSALLVSLGGMHRDGELQALAAAGLRPLRAVRSLGLLVLAAALVAALLAHLVLPRAMADIRDSRERFLSAAVGQRVADRRPISLGEGVQVWADAAEGGRLSGVTARIAGDDGQTVAFAPRARWQQSGDDLRFTMEDVVLVRIEAGVPTTLRMPSWTVDQLEEREQALNPDSLPTGELWPLATAKPEPGSTTGWRTYNNARLALELRLILPLAVVCLAVFAAGVGVVAGIGEALVAVGVMALLTVGCLYPAIGYTKSGVSSPKADPAWLLLPPLIAITAVGIWCLLRAGRPGTLLPRRG
jgi:lipopolysaccharide export LptBFGC system permease protein LptF